MQGAMRQALDLVEHGQTLANSAAVGASLLTALAPLGARSLWARSFELTPGWTDPKVNMDYQVTDFARYRRDDWWGSEARRYADTVCPLGIGAGRLREPFLTSEIATHDDRAYREYWSALGSFGVDDTLAAICFRPGGTAEIVSIWLERSGGLSPTELGAMKLAGLMALQRMSTLADAKKPRPVGVSLSPRERDCLSYVAEGKSDWEISVILAVAQTTVHAHVENAKRKLGARTRAQAVARFVTMQLL